MNGKAERPDAPDFDDSNDEPMQANGQATGSAEAESVPGDDNDIAALQARVTENWDRYLRTAAELENVRKRSLRDVDNARKYAVERFSTDLLDVRDSLEMAISTGADASVESLLEGAETTLRLLTGVMQRFGVEEVDPLGEPFDPERHEAMTMQPSKDAEPGSVLTVFQKGYALNGRLLRPARVVVAAEMPDPAGQNEG